MIRAAETTRPAASMVIEGPGDVAIEYRPAGPGSRFLAALLDHLVLGAIFVFALILLQTTGEDFRFVAVAWLLLYVTYFTVLETRTGRTLGKAAVGLRVLEESGEPVTPRGALVRNVLRIADFLPQGIPGIMVMMIDPQTRRLGDLLGGTVVVREAGSRFSRDLLLRLPYRSRPHCPEEALQRITLDPLEYQALRTFCFRTRTIPARRRERLARLLLAPLRERALLDPPAPHEQEELLVDLLHRESGTFGRVAAGIVGAPPEAPVLRP